MDLDAPVTIRVTTVLRGAGTRHTSPFELRPGDSVELFDERDRRDGRRGTFTITRSDDGDSFDILIIMEPGTQ